METQKSSELRVRLRRIKSGTGKLRSGIPAVPGSSKMNTLTKESSESDDDFATVHFKLAAALEAAAAHASGLNYDWCNSKAFVSTGDTTIEAKTEKPIAKQIKVKMQEFQPYRARKDHPDNDKEEEKVNLVIATPSNSSCSSEDEGIAELHDGKVSDSVLTTIIPATCDVVDDEQPLAVSEQAPTYFTAMNTMMVKEASDSTSVTAKSDNQAAVTNILALPPFDPYAPQLKVQLMIKQIVSLVQLKQRIVDSSKGAISKNGPISECEIVAEMEFANIHVKHGLEEFFTFCSCKNCLEYREIVVHLMVDQFKAQHMVVMLVDALVKAYSPMLKNATAHNKFEKLLDANKEIYWMTCGYIYNKMAEHMYFIYDESLSDNMILVLFSAILLVNNPLLLLQILSFHVTCIVKAYAEGFLEIVDPDKNKIPAEEMLTYILDGYDDLCRISEHISCYLFAFENDFLRKFSLTWTLLCQRLYQQHVYLNLTDTMLACIITLKEDELKAHHAVLIKKYIRFDDKMLYVDKRWTDIWMELNKFNLSEVERKKRVCLLDVHRIFETVVQDAIELSLRESSDDNDFYDFQTLENRQLAWQNIMAYMKMKWPDGFFDPPNTLICEDKCKNCKLLLEYHADTCKCITCSIAGGPLPPKRNPDNTCYKCLALLLVEKEVTFYESKILNVCASDDFLSFIKNNEKRKSSTLEELGVEVCSALATDEKLIADDHQNPSDGIYHLAWAVFRHLNNRKRYKKCSVEEKFFCSKCEFQACRLARKILNNEIALALSLHLIRYYQPLSMSREELRSILPNIMLYNRKMISSNIGLDLNDVHDLVVKIYWTFVISVYATYFIEFNNDCPLRLENFELVNNDIKLKTENLLGDKNDTKFVLFLDKIKSLSCEKDELESEMENSDDGHAEEIQKKLEDFLKTNENVQSSQLFKKIPSKEFSTEYVPETPTVASSSKKTCKDKSRKCCFDHSDLGDHCKENHSNKKRIKKECNHARMNETRDRLRKKLSQLVSARKNMKTPADKQPTLQPTKINHPSKLKAASKAAASASGANIKAHTNDDSLECLNTLCKRISNLSTGKASTTETAPAITTKTTRLNATTKSSTNKNNTNGLTKEPSHNKALNYNIQAHSGEKNSSKNAIAAPSSGANKKNGNGLDMVNEIYELLGTYSKDHSKVKKWINETLSYIEGSSGGSGKQQPQPTNAKKAAKKAKQKQRREEEKRIAELQDLRGQFHDIYFKEFMDKYELKELKSSKKRDKKKISELETNVKNLQRAKAKVETSILELIATVKQTNTEFKFSYLPTKEQQLEKIQQLNATGTTASNNTSVNMPRLINGGMQHSQPHQFMISSLQTNTHNLSATNIATSSYSLPYPQVNNFPYHQIDVQNGVASMPFAMIRPPLSTPMCYAPPKHQQLSPDVVAAITANAACNSTNDPSKRIVTIRRINLPNVPEPQVTVTAKGSSPDKDKLLYTFVNGQLLQNETAVPPITELPEVPLQPANLPAGTPNCISSSVPSLSLSKTQLKKERRRLAQKLIEEAEAAIKTEKLLKEDLQLHKLREDTAKRARKKTKIITKDKLSMEPEEHLSSTKSKKKKKRMADSSASATSISTTDAAELLTSASSAISTQRRSSSATSYSAAVPSSGVSTISPINTRDNSVCSKKAKELEGKLQLKSNIQITQKQTKKGKKQSTKNPPTPPSTQPTIQEVEPSQTTEFDSVSNVKKRKLKRPKFIDNGQFDNNPFKSLHVQDFSSDSEILTSSCDEDENDVRTEYKYNETQTQEPVVLLKQNNLKLRAGTREQNKTDTSDVVLCKQENKKQEHCRLSNENTRLSLHTNDKNYKRCETTKAKLTIVENQKSLKTNRNLLKGQSQEQKQSASLAQPKYQQQPLRAKNAAQQRPSSSQQQASTSKRNSVLTTRYDLSTNQRTSTIVSSSNPLPGSSMNTRHNCTRSTASASENQRKNSLEKSSNPLSKRALKQAQRNKHKSQKQHSNSNNDLYAGIPTNMGYFKANDFTTPSLQIKQQQKQFQHLKQCQQQQYKTIQQQMQNMQISNNHCPPQQQQKQRNHKYQSCNSFLLSSGDSKSSSEINSVHKSSTTSATANVSIMDQLNRGVQVENLSLPPGITLTKVDPVKSEQLRKKSESIKKLAKPLQQQPLSQSFHHPGATIIAPPVAPVSGYYGLPYAGVAAAASLGQNGGGGSVIMLEAMPPNSSTSPKHQQIKLNTAASVAPAASSKTKTSKSKKRRNKSKLVNNPPQPGSNSAATAEPSTTTTSNGQPKMVTLRNPMFHNGPPGATAAIIQQPTLMTGRTVGGLPIAAALPMDQPASIIKNENGMFTIRNPALQQAVANGLAIGGYRQFGNVNYYTPQEAMAEAARATQQSAANTSGLSPTENATFSYFSNSSASDQPQQGGGGPVTVNETTCPDFSRNTQHSNANLICTRLIGGSDGLPGDSAVIARPVQPAKCISAIGSEIKNAQQQKQKSIEHKWTNFGQELSNNTSSDTLARSSSFLSGSSRGVMTTSPIQDKYSHSTYYNGFVDVFPANSSQISACGRSSNTGSFFDSSDCHIKHNCGDDSPPPTISGFNHYLEGIPNTGVIRYDDATFLKTLMPGQNLNNEVSIHNVNDSNFSRNSTSPLAHSVEISAVYEHCSNSSTNYRDGLNEYGNDVNLFTPTSLLNESVNRDVESFKRFNYDFEHHKDKQKVHMNLNDLVIHKASSTSNRTSPFMDENVMDKFVQNVNALHISVPTARKTDEQCSQLNIGAGTSGACDSANGWW